MFVSVFVKATVAPCSADATVWPVNVSAADAVTVNGARLVVNGPTFDTPSLYVNVARLLIVCGARPLFTFTWKGTGPREPGATRLIFAAPVPGAGTW